MDRRISKGILAVVGGTCVTTALFLLIPLMNRSIYEVPEPKKPSRVYNIIRKSRKPPEAVANKAAPRPKPKAPTPPKPPRPKPKFRTPPLLEPRFGPSGSPLRFDPGEGIALAPGGIPLYVPEEPEAFEERPDPAGKEEPPGLEKSLYLPHEIDSPPRTLRRVTPVYPSGAYRRGIEGFALLRFVVNARGKVSDIRVAEWEGSPTFGEAAEKALLKWSFSPGLRGGKSVSVRCQLRFYFREED